MAWANVDPYPGSFDNAGLTFGEAVEAMRVGAVVTRPGLGFDVHLLRECCIHTHSSPDPVIQKYSNQGVPLITAMPAFRTVGLNNTKNGIDLATATGWIPTTEDILATNWEISQR